MNLARRAPQLVKSLNHRVVTHLTIFPLDNSTKVAGNPICCRNCREFSTSRYKFQIFVFQSSQIGCYHHDMPKQCPATNADLPKHRPGKSTAQCAFRNGRFWFEARPHKGFRRRRSSATSRTEARGERRIGPKYAIYGWTLSNSLLCL